MKFDPRALASQAGAPLRAALSAAIEQRTPEAQFLRASLESYEADVASTLLALEASVDTVQSALLVEDLERFLPARKAAIKARAAALSGSFAEDVLLGAFAVSSTIALMVARAYVPALGAIDKALLDEANEALRKKVKEG